MRTQDGRLLLGGALLAGLALGFTGGDRLCLLLGGFMDVELRLLLHLLLFDDKLVEVALSAFDEVADGLLSALQSFVVVFPTELFLTLVGLLLKDATCLGCTGCADGSRLIGIEDALLVGCYLVVDAIDFVENGDADVEETCLTITLGMSLEWRDALLAVGMLGSNFCNDVGNFVGRSLFDLLPLC